MAGMSEGKERQQPRACSARLTVHGITGPDLTEARIPARNQLPDDGLTLDLFDGAASEEDRYAWDAGSTDREMFMAMLEMAKVKQLMRIANALEKLAGIETKDPEE
jgi:hypothetical protein